MSNCETHNFYFHFLFLSNFKMSGTLESDLGVIDENTKEYFEAKKKIEFECFLKLKARSGL